MSTRKARLVGVPYPACWNYCNLCQDHSAHTKPHAWNRCNGGLHLRKDDVNLLFNLRNLAVKSVNQSNGVSELKRFGSNIKLNTAV